MVIPTIPGAGPPASDPSGLFITGDEATSLEEILVELGARFGITLRSAGEGAERVELRLVDSVGREPATGVRPSGGALDEGYRIRHRGSWRLEASTEEGLFRGLVTVLQHQALKIGLHDVVDRPALAWRGLTLDIARDFRTVGEIEAIIDVLALYKMNVLHLHLSDNQGWRLGSEGYPRLTSDSPHLTVAEYEHLAAYAQRRFVTIVPELDMPGHTLAAFAACPEFAGNVEYPHPALKYLDPRVPEAMEFARTVVSELAESTPTPFIHIGGDEAFGMPGHLFPEFFHELVPHVHRLGKRAVAWQEVSRTEALTEQDLLQLWICEKDAFDAPALKERTPEQYHQLIDEAARTFAKAPSDAQRAAEQGIPVILSPTSPLYFDRPHAGPAATPEQEAIRTRVGFPDYEPEPLSAVYEFDPFAAARSDGVQLAGVGAALWAETISSFDDAVFLLLPRLAIAAERMWSRSGSAFSDITARLQRHGPLWRAAGMDAYFRPAQDG